MGGCVGRLLGLVLLMALGAAAWLWGPEALERVRAETGFDFGLGTSAIEDTEPPSEALAGEAGDRLTRLLEGSVEGISLTAAEVESLLRFRLPVAWPEGVSDPRVAFRNEDLVLGLQLSRDRLPSLPELESVLAFLPDTVPVELRGRVLALAGGEAALLVHRIEASSVPIPRRFFSRILESVRGDAPADLPPEAFVLPLPSGIRSARIEDNLLVLSRVP